MKSKKTLAGMAFFMGTAQLALSGSAFAQSGIDLQALKLLEENRISKEEFLKLMKPENGTFQCASVTEGNYSANSITEGNYSANSITEGNYSANSITEGNYSANGITNGGLIINPENLELPRPQIGEGVGE